MHAVHLACAVYRYKYNPKMKHTTHPRYTCFENGIDTENWKQINPLLLEHARVCVSAEFCHIKEIHHSRSICVWIHSFQSGAWWCIERWVFLVFMHIYRHCMYFISSTTCPLEWTCKQCSETLFFLYVRWKWSSFLFFNIHEDEIRHFIQPFVFSLHFISQ